MSPAAGPLPSSPAATFLQLHSSRSPQTWLLVLKEANYMSPSPSGALSTWQHPPHLTLKSPTCPRCTSPPSETRSSGKRDFFRKPEVNVISSSFFRKSTNGRKRLKRNKFGQICQSTQSQSNTVCHVTSHDLRKSERPNIPLLYTRDSPGTAQVSLRKISSLCDTGASHSVIPYKLAKHMNLKIDTTGPPVYIRTASNERVKCIGKTMLYTKHPDSNIWTTIHFIVVRQAQILIISNKDLKRLRILEERFPYFIGNKPSTYNIPADNMSDYESDGGST